MSKADDHSASSVILAVRRCLALLDPAERRRWWPLIPLALASAGLEAVGAALIFTLIEVIGEPARIHQIPMVSRAFEAIGFTRPGAFVMVFSALVAVFYVLKNGVLFYAGWVANRRAARSVSQVSRRLLEGYLAVPYAFHFRRSSADLIRNVSTVVDNAYRGGMVAAVAFCSELLLILSILAVLVFTAPGVTVVLGLLMGLLFFALVRLTQRVFARWGKRLHELSGEMMASLQQSLGGVKEVKVLGRERHFYEGFGRLRDDASVILWRRAAMDQAPRLFTETLFVLGVAGVIVAFEAAGQGRQVVPLLGLFGYAGFRILPSLHRVVFNVNTLRFVAPAIHEVWDEWERALAPALAARDAEGEATAALPFARTIELVELGYRYGPDRPPALEGVSLTITKGESIGVVGATGAGKSTLVDLLLGLLEPTAGELRVDGANIAGMRRAWQRRIGFVPQSIYLLDDTLRRNIALGLADAEIDEAKVRAAIEEAQLGPLVERLPEGLDTTVGERGIRLSGGERQRVAVARALYVDPEVLVFDEATSALDNHTEREVTRAIEGLQGEKTMIIVAHRSSTVRRCDRLVVLDAGRVVDVGSFEELSARSPAFRRIAALDEPPRG